MASSQTGQLDTTFLGSTNVIPRNSPSAQNRGKNRVKLWGNRKQRTWSRKPKGNVTHQVTLPARPIKIRSTSPNTL